MEVASTRQDVPAAEWPWFSLELTPGHQKAPGESAANENTEVTQINDSTNMFNIWWDFFLDRWCTLTFERSINFDIQCNFKEKRPPYTCTLKYIFFIFPYNKLVKLTAIHIVWNTNKKIRWLLNFLFSLFS